jgi:hypothetical protein
MLGPYTVAAILILVLLERSVEAWNCPLVVVRPSLLVVSEHLVGLLNLRFISSGILP